MRVNIEHIVKSKSFKTRASRENLEPKSRYGFVQNARTALAGGWWRRRARHSGAVASLRPNEFVFPDMSIWSLFESRSALPPLECILSRLESGAITSTRTSVFKRPTQLSLENVTFWKMLHISERDAASRSRRRSRAGGLRVRGEAARARGAASRSPAEPGRARLFRQLENSRQLEKFPRTSESHLNGSFQRVCLSRVSRERRKGAFRTTLSTIYIYGTLKRASTRSSLRDAPSQSSTEFFHIDTVTGRKALAQRVHEPHAAFEGR